MNHFPEIPSSHFKTRPQKNEVDFPADKNKEVYRCSFSYTNFIINHMIRSMYMYLTIQREFISKYNRYLLKFNIAMHVQYIYSYTQ